VSERRARRIAWAAFLLFIAMSFVAVLLGVLSSVHGVPKSHNPIAASVVQILLGIPFIAVGPLLVARRPDNAIGWLFCGVALLWSFDALAFSWGAWTLYGGGDLPGPKIALWISAALQVVPLFSGPIYLFLLFPTGKPLTPRWRWAGWALAAVTVVAVLSLALRPGELTGDIAIENPVAIHGPVGDFLGSLDPVNTVAAGILFLLSATSLIMRLHRSRGLERLQIKWVVYLGGVAAACIVIAFVAQPIAQYVFPVGLAAIGLIPIAAGLAILRYRLYEIDRVINRTLVYASLTAILVGAYLGCVLLLQLALDPVTSGSSLAVAVSTLAVAALFRPARARIQSVVDRRFYRSRYDAAHTLEAFSTRLREQVDLEALAGELRGVVSETMQPAHVSLWLREAKR
jgi:hypothetical protein